MVLYTHDGESPMRSCRRSRPATPTSTIDDLVARGWPALHDLCERYIAVGFSKLVLVPLGEPHDWDDELAANAAVLLPLQR